MTTKQTVKKGVSAKALAPLIAGLLLVLLFALALISGSLLTPATAKACHLCEGDGGLTISINGMIITGPADAEGYATQLFIAEGRKASFTDYPSGSLTIGSLPCNLNELYANGTLKKGTEYSFICIKQDLGEWNIQQHSNIIYYSGGDFMPLPENPTKEGHTFIGWFFDEACTRPYDFTPITADTTLYAGWKILTYTLSFDSAGGSSVARQVLDWNTAPPLLATPERTGYDFLGWFLPDGTVYEKQPIKANTTLTAKWKIKTVIVKFMVDGKEYKTIPVDYGTTFEQAMELAKMQNYNLLDGNGLRDGKSGIITESVTVMAAEMTQKEKVGAWVSNNLWALWAGLGLVAALGLALGIAIAVAHKRG